MSAGATIALIGLLVAVMVMIIGWEMAGRAATMRSRTARLLAQVDEVDEEDVALTLPAESWEGKLRSAGLGLTPVQFALGCVLLGLAATALTWVFFVPGVPALALGALAGWAPVSYVNDKAAQRGLEMEKLLPVAMSRIASGLQAGHGLAVVLEEVGESLEMDAPGNPLSPELIQAAKDARSLGVERALRDLARRSPSLSVSNVAMLLLSYHRAGGGQYASVVIESANAMQRLLALRNHVRAKAGQAMAIARVLPVVLGLTVLTLVNDPFVGPSLRYPIVQLAMGVVIGIMVFGYRVMRNEVRRAM